MNFKKKLIAATPIFCLIVFLILGFQFDKWHPGWCIFLLIPIMPFLIGEKKFYFSYPLFCMVIYFTVGLCFHTWHPTWIIFLTIPLFYIFFPKTKIIIEEDDLY